MISEQLDLKFFTKVHVYKLTMKVFFCLLMVMFALPAFSQPEEKFYSNGNLQSRGEYQQFTGKGSYGYSVNKVKDGYWEYYYEDGTPALYATYEAHKRGEKPVGVWEYYSPRGDLLKKEYYKKGDVIATEFFSEGLFNFTTDSFRIISIDYDTMQLTHYMRGNPFKELLVNRGDDVFVFARKINSIEVPEDPPIQAAALLDDGFVLEDTTRNLIVNYGFETYHSELMKYTEYNKLENMADTFVHNWYSASGTPDYFLDPEWAKGRTEPRHCGIRIYSTEEYLEYLQNQLREPLKAGHKYCCRVFFKLSNSSAVATDAIGFKFSNKLLKFHYRAELLPVPDIINTPNQLLMEKKKWMQLTGLYTAKGGEEYFTFGGFKALGAMHKLELKEGKQMAYYYVDDVYVYEVADIAECPCNAITVPDSLKRTTKIKVKKERDTAYQPGKTFIIKNIYFDTDKSILLPKSFAALDSLVAIMHHYPTMEIEITGHTDNTGTPARNIPLSKNRAEAVMDYLLLYGVDPKRLSYEGYADKEPIDTNDTPEGRQNNRRVQFRIVRM